MKGFITRAAGLVAGAAAVAGGGCYYRDVVDPCWPERYNYVARQEVNAAFAPQVQNGHVLDQTVWNYDFEEGTDRLTAGGLERVAYLCPGDKAEASDLIKARSSCLRLLISSRR